MASPTTKPSQKSSKSFLHVMLHYKHSILKYKMKHRVCASFIRKDLPSVTRSKTKKDIKGYGSVLDNEGGYMGKPSKLQEIVLVVR